MIYLDTSVALVHLLVEDRKPAEALWRESLISSRLLEYEMWNRLNARNLAGSHGEAARELIGRVALVELGAAGAGAGTGPLPGGGEYARCLASRLDRVPPRSPADGRAGEL